MQGNRVQRVFILVLALNLAVALAKAIFGLLAGSVSMVADAFHSGFDSFSNVVGIVALYFAGRPPDPEHPYGHGKIETLGTLVIGAMLLLTAAGILYEGYRRLIVPVTPDITAVTVGVMLATLAINIAVSTYERRRGEEYQSQILVADSQHTRSDVFVSVAVIGGFIAVRLGFPAADPLIAFAIGLLIARMGLSILYDAAQVRRTAADPQQRGCRRTAPRRSRVVRKGVQQRDVGRPAQRRERLHHARVFHAVPRPFSGEGIRVTIGSPEENDRFLATLAEVATP